MTEPLYNNWLNMLSYNIAAVTSPYINVSPRYYKRSVLPAILSDCNALM